MIFSPPDPRTLRSILASLASIVIITMINVFVFLAACRTTQHLPVASGVPDEPPRQECRVFHPAGYSIVRPRFWDSKVSWLASDIRQGGIFLESPCYNFPHASLMVAKVATKPDLSGEIRDIQFQGRPALMTMDRRTAEFM